MAKPNKTRGEIVAESKKKGVVATGSAVVTGVAAVTIGLGPLTLAGVGATGYFTWKWVRHRMKNGIRF